MSNNKNRRWKNLLFDALTFLLRILKQVFLLQFLRKK